jgi:predicted DNA repair protein MutK
MLGGAYLCFEGAEKILHVLKPHDASQDIESQPEISAAHLEEAKVAGAIKTDFILSAEIMTIALAALPPSGVAFEVVALALVAIGITVLVYGSVALIVKADDIGLHLANRKTLTPLGPASQSFGRGMVRAMPYLLKLLSTVGTLAMLLVGGGIVLHGLEVLGLAGPAHAVHGLGLTLAEVLPWGGGFTEWLMESILTALVGFALGLVLIPLVTRVLLPVSAALRGKKPGGH